MTQIQRGMGEQRDPRTYAIIGAAMEVHRVLGPCFLEAVYQEALAIEMTDRGTPFVREKQLSIDYKGRVLNTRYRSDFVCYDAVLVETKALKDFSGAESAQIINYLCATQLEAAVLLNFAKPSLEYRRLILSSPSAPSA